MARSFRLTATADRIETSCATATFTSSTTRAAACRRKRKSQQSFAPQLDPRSGHARAIGGFPDFRERERGLPIAPLTCKLVDPARSTRQSSAVRQRPSRWRELVAEQYEGAAFRCSSISATKQMPYVPRPFPQFALRFGTYDHLARVKEWSAGSQPARIMIDRPIPPETISRAELASDPRHYAWVSLNAGSGKTHVLAQRVVAHSARLEYHRHAFCVSPSPKPPPRTCRCACFGRCRNGRGSTTRH